MCIERKKERSLKKVYNFGWGEGVEATGKYLYFAQTGKWVL